MRIRVIGVPMDLGADRRGVDIGASAIRYAGLNDQLKRLGYSVNDIGNIVVPQPESQPIGDPHLKYLEPIIQVSEDLAEAVSAALQAGEFHSSWEATIVLLWVRLPGWRGFIEI